ncbi:hypothetical protein L207DRAFT_564580 [Hyaloscypha variabilis F]|uniref:Uncharacterized protein n=1 Tax=Hyaloscypha variabilis (strain UAMH 11265 / GT02V1 / F) TaxID=1149755 RepID=A0A2J6RUP3_HYAVF|nr:hypothetical protein L207DRAFT_564580 [Hyaloscypha variabilis F]
MLQSDNKVSSAPNIETARQWSQLPNFNPSKSHTRLYSSFPLDCFGADIQSRPDNLIQQPLHHQSCIECQNLTDEISDSHVRIEVDRYSVSPIDRSAHDLGGYFSCHDMYDQQQEIGPYLSGPTGAGFKGTQMTTVEYEDSESQYGYGGSYAGGSDGKPPRRGEGTSPGTCPSCGRRVDALDQHSGYGQQRPGNTPPGTQNQGQQTDGRNFCQICDGVGCGIV